MADVPNYVNTGHCRIFQVIVDLDGFRLKHGFDIHETINLCGGIPDPKLDGATVEVNSTGEDTIEVNVDTDLYFVSRTIDYSTGLISNDFMEAKKKDNHIGTTLFLNQVRQARCLGFTELITQAQAPLPLDLGYVPAGHVEKIKWDGYYRWARVGYQMVSPRHITRLNKLLADKHRTEKTLRELVLNEKKTDGYAFWKDNGFTWSGMFDLRDGSESMDHLLKYLAIAGVTHYTP